MYRPSILRLLAALVILGSTVSLLAASPAESIDWVNPLIGTAGGKIGYGGTMPFVTPPFGMTNWTPQTRQNKISVVSYNYDDKTVSGFMGTHQPAIWMGDYGYITLMPEIGALKTTPDSRKLPFRHADEVSHPDFYSVTLDAGNGKQIRSEMTATERCGYLRFTFPANTAGRVLIEASRAGHAGYVQVDAASHEIAGYNPDRMDAHLGPAALKNFKGYFVVQFRQAFEKADTYGMDDAQAGHARGGYAEFAPAKGKLVVEMRVGTSFLSVEQARANLKHEIPEWSFEKVRLALREKWNAKLNRIEVQGASDEARRTVYTAAYHALLYPRVFSEYGHYYSAFDDKIHDGASYTSYSIWDTFRAENSLLTLLAPERVDGMVTALLQDYREGGWMPKWPNPGYTNIMIGTHADSLVAEAIRKNFHGFDRELAWKAVYKDAMTPPDGDTSERWADRAPHTPYEARGGLTYYKELGYIPTDKTAEAASRTLEDSYDDWCVAQVAKALGKEKDYQFFLHRSLNYRNLYNSTGGLMRGKTSDEKWASEDAGWTEGNAWVYTWAPLHDEAGILNLMGGAKAYNAKLDQHFAGGHNVHSNEPSHHYGYLYDFSGEPWKTQAKVREIAAAEYAGQPVGLDGDDDCGQMSAWYLFTALGIYPVNPASGDYMIGSPMFSRMSLQVAKGKRFTVIADNNSATNVYIQSATLNGKPLSKPVIRYEDMMAGSTLHFVMGPKPSHWAADWRAKAIQ